ILDAFDGKAAPRSFQEHWLGIHPNRGRDRLSRNARSECHAHHHCIAAATDVLGDRVVESRSASPLRRRLRLLRISAVVVCGQRKNKFGKEFGSVPSISVPSACVLRDSAGNSACKWRVSTRIWFLGALTLRFTDSFTIDFPARCLPLLSSWLHFAVRL